MKCEEMDVCVVVYGSGSCGSAGEACDSQWAGRGLVRTRARGEESPENSYVNSHRTRSQSRTMSRHLARRRRRSPNSTTRHHGEMFKM
ncbi:hypothetical protein F2P81_005621 [Scophthalmus maximus]|uniref:Uncharacterized protein n=1 Tax=Scophthalmus maximus TaxID=52904 RepID=A0A6A4TB19_SCOMX|nr:hypothetical protein F2P81_005621 [Scophthalmus maximus]